MIRLFATLLFTSSIAYGSLSVFGEQANKRTMETQIGSPVTLKTIEISNKGSNYSEQVSLTPAKINLNIFMDSSRYCSMKKFDEKLSKLLEDYGARMHPESRVSFITYDSLGTQLLAKETNPQSLGEINFQCRKNARSVSIKAATDLLEAQKISKQAIFWVFTSGHTKLDKKSFRLLAKQQSRIFVYNPLVAKDVQKNLSSLLKKENVHFAITKNPQVEHYYRAEFTPPRRLHGKTVRLSFSYQAGEKTHRQAKQVVVPFLEIDYWLVFKKWGAVIALCLVGLWVTWKLAVFYLPKRCRQCKQLVPTGNQCAECTAPDTGFLCGKVNYGDPEKWQKQDLIEIGKKPVTIGTRGGNTIQLPRPKGMRRAKLIEVRKETVADGKTRFRILPNRSVTQHRLELNELPIVQECILSNGDKINVNGHEITFFQRGVQNG